MFLFRLLPDHGKGVKHAIGLAPADKVAGELGLPAAMSYLLCLGARNPGFYLSANATALC